MSEELRTEELLTNEGHTETMADYEDHFDDANPWNRVLEYMEKKTILPVKIEGIVNGGAIAMVEGLRGFIPASKLSLSYIEDLETYLLKDVEVQVIDVDQAGNRLVLSARELLKEKERKEKEAEETEKAKTEKTKEAEEGKEAKRAERSGGNYQSTDSVSDIFIIRRCTDGSGGVVWWLLLSVPNRNQQCNNLLCKPEIRTGI